MMRGQSKRDDLSVEADDGGENGGPLGYVFAVGDRPYCCWDFDHEARTSEYLDGVDPDYFRTITSVFADRLESDDQLPVSVALRVSYHQGLETLMSLLGATAQAPLAVPAWIAVCKTDDLIDIAGRLRAGRPMLTQEGKRNVSFLDLSEQVHRFAWTGERGNDSTAAHFGRFWRRISNDFLDDTARAEYNALKHGTRVMPGGFTLALGLEESPGVPAPPEAMRSMGGSRFGSTFFVADRVGTSKSHIRTRRTSVNWSPLTMAQRLDLVSMSITNVVGALRCELGSDPASVMFVGPEPRSAFEDVWTHRLGATSIRLDSVISIDPSDELSKEQLLTILEQRSSGSTTAANRDEG